MEKVRGSVRVGNVRLYALSTCIWCRKTKQLLDTNDIEYEYVYVDELEGEEKEAVKKQILELTGKLSFPTVVINDTTVVGFDEPKLRKELRL